MADADIGSVARELAKQRLVAARKLVSKLPVKPPSVDEFIRGRREAARRGE